MADSPSTNPTNPLNILIVGAGVCGPILAVLLQRSNPDHNITIIERWPSLRTGGQQIDLKAQGIPIMRRLGLLEEIRKVCVQEPGMEIVDHKGKKLIQFGVTKAGDKGASFELTNEFEFMRGDFVQIAYEASLKDRENLEAKGHTGGSLTYLFNTSLTGLSQDAGSTTTSVTFSTGETKSYDLVVATDGQGSRTRRLAFGDAVNKEAFKSLGIHAAFYNIPRLPKEDGFARLYAGSENRHALTRTGNCPHTQVYFFVWKSSQHTHKMKAVHQLPIEEQKAAWAQLFRNIGWQAERFTRALDTVDDFYATEIAQIKMPSNQLYTGRVVLLGDAGYCASPMTGQGTTLSIAGAYTLTGELATHPHDVEAALKAYETKLRPLIDDCHTLGPLVNGGKGLFPQSSWGIWLVNHLIWLIAVFRIDKLLERLAAWMPEEKKEEWALPEYPGMNMEAY